VTPYEQVMHTWEEEILSNARPSCTWTLKAVERQRRDLLRQNTPAFPYVWDPDAGGTVVDFIACLTHLKGEFAGKPFLLSPWQVFCVMCLFGWKRADNTRLRRFRRFTLQCGKSSGKTTLSSALCLYMLAADCEGGAEIVTAARATAQARLTFDTARDVCRANPKLCAAFGLRILQHSKGNRSLTTTADGDDFINGLKQLDEFFGFGPDNPGPPVTLITTDRARDFADKRLAEGLSNATVNRSLSCLRRMLKIAHEDSKLQFVPKIRFLKEPSARKGFVEQAKFDELLALLPTHLRPLIMLLYYCGVRAGEARQIEWPQVDLKTRIIRLEDEQTKSAEPRIIPLPSVLVALLREIEPKTGRVFSDVNLRVEWERACTACGLGKRTKMEPKNEDGFVWYKYRGLLIHDLRRSAVRNLRKAGVNESVIMKISGHRTAEVFRRYNIVSADDVSTAMQRLEAVGLSSDSSVTVPANKQHRLRASRSK